MHTTPSRGENELSVWQAKYWKTGNCGRKAMSYLGHKGAGPVISKPTGLTVAWEVSGFLERGRVLAARAGLWRGEEGRRM